VLTVPLALDLELCQRVVDALQVLLGQLDRRRLRVLDDSAGVGRAWDRDVLASALTIGQVGGCQLTCGLRWVIHARASCVVLTPLAAASSSSWSTSLRL